MDPGDRWRLVRFEHVIPFQELADSERPAVRAWLHRVAQNPARAGMNLLPSLHAGVTLPEPEREDGGDGFENLWSGWVPGTRYICTYQVNYADHEVVCCTFEPGPYPFPGTS